MNLLTDRLRARLRANADAHTKAQAEGLRDPDPIPVVKFFNPCGGGTWLATELAPDDDTLFGLADLGFGFPELGAFALSELETVRLRFGLSIERDRYFWPRFPLSVYAEAARRSDYIVEDAALLRAAAIALGFDPDVPISPATGG